MRIFLAGIMQGSHQLATMHNQDYRQRLKRLLAQHWSAAEVYDPLSDHNNSLDYTPAKAREVFLKHNRMCGETDVLVAFVPEASMGTAIEMWEAAQHGKVVVAVSPLHLNWAIRFCSDIIYATFDELELAVATGNLQSRVRELQTHKMPSGKTT